MSGSPPERLPGRRRDSIEALLEANLPALRAYVRLRTGALIRAQESCTDLVQSVCREVLTDLDRFEPKDEAAFRHWLFETALRKILDRERHWRAAKRDAALLSPLPASDADGQLLACYSSISTPSRHAEAREEIERLEQAFDRLPEHYREVIVQARILGLPQAEIARMTGRTEDSVRNLLARALARLSTTLSA